MKKAILKRTADALEKLAIGSMLVGLFQGHQVGIYIGLGLYGIQLYFNSLGGQTMSIWIIFGLACLAIAGVGIWAHFCLKS